MATYLISYDLGMPETSDDYRRLIAHIKSYDTWATPLKSVWLIKTFKSVEVVRNEVGGLLDSTDQLLVIDVTGKGWGTLRVPKEVTDWMQINI